MKAPGHGSSLNFISFRATTFLSHPPPPVYSFNFTPGLCCYKHGSFLALGYENMPVQASIRCWPWRWDSPITTYVICMPSFVRVMCAFKYASTNQDIMRRGKISVCSYSRRWRLVVSVGKAQMKSTSASAFQF